MEKTFNEALGELGLFLPVEVRENILKFFIFLRKKNEVLNLISSRQDLKTQTVIHLVDSLTPLLLDEFPGSLSVLDIGSGGGLPALPLALARPSLNWVLAEARKKKCLFLREAKEYLNLGRLEVRGEYLKPGLNEEGLFYGLVTARAVGHLADLASLAGPRLKPGGFFLAFKGPRGDMEMKESRRALDAQSLRLIRRLELKLPPADAGRLLLLFEKGNF